MNLEYLSLFSGVEAAALAWEPLGWEAKAFAEIEKFPSAVLAHHWPDVPNLGDITKVDWSEYAGVDVLVGGSPCQSFSVAGLRKGLDDPRGNLMLEYLRAVDKARPRWVVWENVPGVLSADGGRAFGTFLGGLAELGYGFAYRVLDAQFVRAQSHTGAVPQRRRRVFVVGYLGDWRRAAAVLLERESLCGHPAPSREQGTATAALTATGVGTCGADDNQAQAGHLIPDVLPMHDRVTRHAGTDGTDNGRVGREGVGKGHGLGVGEEGDPMYTLTGADRHIVMAPSFSKRPGQQIATRDDGSSFAVTTGEPPRVLAFNWQSGGDVRLGCNNERTDALHSSQTPAVLEGCAVRRLTPRECERLQGMPDSWTQIPWRGKEAEDCPDGPRYKAIGNSMAVNVMSWLGRRIMAVDALE